jgi:C-terminal processing protease CtpA/Prc
MGGGVSKENIEELKNAFLAEDTNNDGTVSLEELKKYRQKAEGDNYDEAAVEADFKKFDKNGDGHLLLEEYLESHGVKHKLAESVSDAEAVKRAAGNAVLQAESKAHGGMSEVVVEIEPKAFGIKCNGQEITDVTKGSQAEKKGVKKGWTVMEINGQAVKTTADVTKALMAGKKGGKKYTGKFMNPKGKSRGAPASTSGGGNRKEMDIDPKPLGIKCNGQEITSVGAGSQAEKNGIAVGWKVVEIGGTKVTTTADVTKALMAGKKAGKKYKAVFILPGKSSAQATTTTAAAPAAAAAAKPVDSAESEAAKKKAAEEAEAAAIAEEERKARMTGEVTLKYEMYGEKFKIKDGMLEGGEGEDGGWLYGSKYVDEEYALSFVMPNCRVHLSTATKQAVALAEGDEKWKMFVKEEPDGTWGEAWTC